MSDSANEPQAHAGTLSEITAVLNAAKDMQGQIASYLKEAVDSSGKAAVQATEAEIARTKADSEGLFAFNAKEACEKHSTYIAEKKGQAESDQAAITSNRTTAEASAQAVFAARATIEAQLPLIAAAKKTSEDSAAASVSAKDSSQKSATDSQLKLNEISETSDASKSLRDGITKHAEKASSLLGEITTSDADAKKCKALIDSIKTDSDATKLSLNETLTAATAQLELIKKSVETVNKTQASINEYEASLKRLNTEYTETRARIEKLLPWSTSASLASAFRDQKKRFFWPRIAWMALFILCIVGLVGNAIYHFKHDVQIDPSTNMSWKTILFPFIHNLPFVLPLIWLAWVAGRQYMLSLKMEEDYAFKETVSSAFEGYKREMASVESGDGTPLRVLCANVLQAISERPGRIYEAIATHDAPHSPLSDAANELMKVAEGLKSAIPKPPTAP